MKILCWLFPLLLLLFSIAASFFSPPQAGKSHAAEMHSGDRPLVRKSGVFPASAEDRQAPLGGASFSPAADDLDAYARTIAGAAIENLTRSLPGQTERPRTFSGLHSYFADLSVDETIEHLPEQHQGFARGYRDELQESSEDMRFFCWDKSTDPLVVAAFHRIEQSALTTRRSEDLSLQAVRFLGLGRWTRTATNGNSGGQGVPMTVTWSFAPDGTTVPGRNNQASAPSDFRARLAAIYGGSATAAAETQSWFPIFEEAFANLGLESGLTLVYEPNDDGVAFNSNNSSGQLGLRGDIRIGGRPIDGNFNVLAFAFSPNSGDMVIDTNDSFYDNTSSNSLGLHNVMAHEGGHSIGLGHVCPVNQTKLMEPTLTRSFRGAQFDERQSLNRQYGDAFERSGNARNNDSAANANTLNLTRDIPTTLDLLSIDAENDSDWFSITIPRDQALTVRVSPIGTSYLEGAQNSTTGECSAGELFNPQTQRNLAFEIRDSGGTILNTESAAGIGLAEESQDFVVAEAGTYFIRVTAGASSLSTAQLYSLEVLRENADLGPEITIAATRIADESNVGRNASIDPEETVRLGVTLENSGTTVLNNISFDLTPAPSLTFFEASNPISSLGAGAQQEIFLTFAQDGDCGSSFSVELAMTTDSGVRLRTIPLELGLTIPLTLSENFDASSSLPAGWSTDTLDAGSPWVTSTTEANSGTRSAFSPGVSTDAVAHLVSPFFPVGNTGGSLEFAHLYNTESPFDGGIIQVAEENGNWSAPGDLGITFETGGYNTTIAGNSTPRLAGQRAWSGNSGVFVTTRLNIPTEQANKKLRFRWRLVHDRTISDRGWFIDDVVFTSTQTVCDPFRPQISLSSDAGGLTERDGSVSRTLTLSTPLPLTRSQTVNPELGGTASEADISRTGTFTLPSGDTSATITLSAVPDSLAEGDETLTLTLPTSSDYGLGPNASATFSIQDSEYGEWASENIGNGSGDTIVSADADGDSVPNIIEYILGTDPNNSASAPNIMTAHTASELRIELPERLNRSDASLIAETSTDLETWTTQNVTEDASGFSTPVTPTDGRFIRLRISTNSSQ